jgi:serine/threonine protein kinase
MTFHRNVLKTKAFCLEPGHMCVISELASNGSLDTLLEKISRGSEPEMDPLMIYYIALSVAQGMTFLHAQNIIHRDVRPLCQSKPAKRYSKLHFSSFNSWLPEIFCCKRTGHQR